jgi:N-acetylglutamate synthase-like GNAT family acetyltransferase
VSNGIVMRPAEKADASNIRHLLKSSGLRTQGIRLNRFVVAVDENCQLIGCGQLKRHGIRFMELQSIAVDESHRRGGIGREIIDHLTAQSPRPLFLMCKSDLVGYYEKRGFRKIKKNEISVHYRLILWIQIIKHGLFKQEILVVMRMD